MGVALELKHVIETKHNKTKLVLYKLLLSVIKTVVHKEHFSYKVGVVYMHQGVKRTFHSEGQCHTYSYMALMI